MSNSVPLFQDEIATNQKHFSKISNKKFARRNLFDALKRFLSRSPFKNSQKINLTYDIDKISNA